MILYCFLLTLWVHASLTAVLDGFKSYKDYKIYEMEGDEYEVNKIMIHLRDNYELPYHSNNGNKCQMLVAPSLAAIVENMAKKGKVSTKVVVDDYSEIIKMEKANALRAKSFSWTAYYDINDIYGYLRNMSRLYPESAETIVGGRSYEGRDILGVRIRTPTRDVKPTIFIESGIHAREWITPATTTYFINQLLTSEDPKIQNLKNSYDWHIFPSVNPDGYHYSYVRDRMWRKTRSKSSARCYGADPNRNWDYNWLKFGSSSNPCDYQTYGGSKPFSEIETRTLAEYISKLDNLKGYIAFHSDAQMLLLPYSDSTDHDQYYDFLKKIGQTSLDFGFQVNKAKYKGPGTATGAKINISDGSCPERIVTVTGNTSAIFKAFTLICKKFEEWCSQFNEGGGGGSRAPITLRLIVPASQCGSLIGKGGSKIKEIRDVTGANIQVASEMLPNSTERAVTISGTCDAITQCIYHICCVMLESPPKGATIPYRPKPNVAGPVILAGGQAYTIQGNYAVPAQDMGGLAKSPLAGLAALGLGGLGPANAAGLNPAALAALAGSQLRTSNQSRNQPATNQQSHEMTVPNELIGCIIGKGGTKIAEIRQISGAMIRISNCEEREGGSTDRTITISGNPDSVALAQYLINMSVELQKANLEGSSGSGGSAGSSTASPLASAIPLAQLLSKSGALGALSSLSALGGLTDLLSGSAQPVQTTGVHRNHKSFSQRRQDDDAPAKSSKERNKYNPY